MKSYYVRTRDGVVGPMSGADLKVRCAEGEFEPEDDIATNPDGPWTLARTVSRLEFPPPGSRPPRKAAVETPQSVIAAERAAAEIESMQMPSIDDDLPEDWQEPQEPQDAIAAPSPAEDDDYLDALADDPLGRNSAAMQPAERRDIGGPGRSVRPRPARSAGSGDENPLLVPFTFTRFVAPEVARALMLVAYAGQTLGFLYALYEAAVNVGDVDVRITLGTVALGFIIYLFSLLLTRVFFEIVVLPFRIYDEIVLTREVLESK